MTAAEWRFLLPSGDPVVALAGARESVASMARRVPDGGVLYWEIDRRSPCQFGLTPERAFASLAAHGLTPTAAYWVKPDFHERQMYLPIASPEAFRWYLDTLYRTPSLSRRFLRQLLQPIATHGRLGAVAPCYAVTAVRGPAAPPELLAHADPERVWSGGGTHAVLLAHARAEWSRVALLLFGRDATAPSTVLKLSRSPRFNQHVEWEHHVLRSLRAALPKALRRSIPESRLLYWHDLAVSVETPVSGAALSVRVGLPTAQAVQDLQACAGWLAAFHSATVTDRAPAREWLTAHLFDGLCKQYAETFVVTDAERRLFAQARRYLDACPAATLPIAWQHTDFTPANVYLGANGVSVIDWEVARPGPVLVDLLHFVTHWSAEQAGQDTETQRLQRFMSLFCTYTAVDPIAWAVREQVAVYMRELGVEESLFPALLLHTVIEQALDLARRRVETGRPAGDRTANMYAAYVDAIGRHAPALFPEVAAA